MAYVNSAPFNLTSGVTYSSLPRDTLRPSGTVEREAGGEVIVQVEVAFTLNRRAAAEREFLELTRRLFAEVDESAEIAAGRGLTNAVR